VEFLNDRLWLRGRLLAVLHSLPLWLFVALAGAGYGALFLPAFGGADIVELRQQWAPYSWLDATIFTIFALTCAADLIAKGLSAHIKTRNNCGGSGFLDSRIS
jgi:hypothetical protein